MKTVNDIQYSMNLVESEREAKEVTNFLRSAASFDDRNFTPGELEHMELCIYESLREENSYYWCVKNETGQIIGALGVKENCQKSGGYIGDYCVIHRNYRKNGIARALHYKVFDFLCTLGARYMLIETCDMPCYLPVRKLLSELGFYQIGHCPDYYFTGEGLVWYVKSFVKDGKANNITAQNPKGSGSYC